MVMISLVQIRCPHCGATGRMVLPPTGTVLIGPCPQCHEMVAIFCGQALPLDTEIMKTGTITEKESHLMAVLTDFIEDQVSEMLHRSLEAEDDLDEHLDSPAVHSEGPIESDWAREDEPEPKDKTISEEELEHFRATELNLIDNPNYFRAIFG